MPDAGPELRADFSDGGKVAASLLRARASFETPAGAGSSG
jgi:hypothetical protein